MTPLLVYDDDCGFCTWSAEFVARHGQVKLVGFSDLTDDQRDRLPVGWRECAHLLMDDAVFSCGAAMEEAFVRTDLAIVPLVEFVRRLPGAPTIRELTYRFVASHRHWFGRLVARCCRPMEGR